jgi:Fe-S cluster assembly iron-binding protein IscA
VNFSARDLRVAYSVDQQQRGDKIIRNGNKNIRSFVEESGCVGIFTYLS